MYYLFLGVQIISTRTFYPFSVLATFRVVFEAEQGAAGFSLLDATSFNQELLTSAKP